jgi:site-specific DNA recombinase
MPHLLRAAIYARVSSEEQREGQTIDSQIAELDRFAVAQGWAVAGVYKDEGWSGALLARPALDRLRDDASRGLFDVALLNDVDRLARDVSHLGIIKRDLERRGVSLRFRKLPADESPTSNLMVNILGSFAEFERELISDRTRRGRRHKVEARQLFLGSRAPYGYRYVTRERTADRQGRLELVPEQAQVVRRIFAWVDEEGLSAMAVVRRLNELGIRPQRGGKAWGKSSVMRVLHCETYAGVWHYNKHESYEPPEGARGGYRRQAKCRNRRRPRAEWIPVALPPELTLVECGRWGRVQAQLRRNRAFSKRNEVHRYLLKGLVECGACGARYVGDPNHGRFYYRCLRRCGRLTSVREEVLSAAVWGAVTESLLNPGLIVEQVRRRESEEARRAAESRREVEELGQALARISEEESRIVEAYRLGALTAEVLRREMDQLQARRTLLEKRQSELSTPKRLPEAAALDRAVRDYCGEVAGRLGALGLEERRRLLQLLVEKVVYEGARVRVVVIIPLNPSRQAGPAEVAMKEESPAPEKGGGAAGSHPMESSPAFSGDRVAPTFIQERDHSQVTQGDRIASAATNKSALNPLFSDDRTEGMSTYEHERKSVFSGDRTEGMSTDGHARNPVFPAGGIAATQGDGHALNSVEVGEVLRFEVTRPLPKNEPILKRENLDLIRKLVKRHPTATLRELSDELRREYDLTMSVTSMSRALRRLGLEHKQRGLALSLPRAK